MRAVLVSLLLLVPALTASAGGNTTPGDTEVSDQAWYLSHEKYQGNDDVHGKTNYQMSQTVPATQIITINQHTAYFVSEEAATIDAGFGRLTWTFTAWCAGGEAVHWAMGYWHDGAFTSGGGSTVMDCPEVQGTQHFEKVVSTFTPTTGFQVPAGAYLAMAVWDDQGHAGQGGPESSSGDPNDPDGDGVKEGPLQLHAGEGQSRLEPAADAPDYDAPPADVDITFIASPEDGTVIERYLYPDVNPGDGAAALSWIQIDIQGSPVEALRLDVPAFQQSNGETLPTAQSLRVRLVDENDQTIAEAPFETETVVLTGSFLGRYYARLDFDAIGHGPNRILPAGTYDGTIAVAALRLDALHLFSDATLSAIGPDAPTTSLAVATEGLQAFTTSVESIVPGQWDLELLAQADGPGVVTTTIQHVDAAGTTTVIAQQTTLVTEATSEPIDIGTEATSPVEADGGLVQVVVAWEGDEDLTLWTHAPYEEPSSLLAPLL